MKNATRNWYAWTHQIKESKNKKWKKTWNGRMRAHNVCTEWHQQKQQQQQPHEMVRVREKMHSKRFSQKRITHKAANTIYKSMNHNIAHSIRSLHRLFKFYNCLFVWFHAAFAMHVFLTYFHSLSRSLSIFFFAIVSVFFC